MLFACLTNEHRVDILSLRGDLLCQAGKQGSDGAGLFKTPFMGATDSEGYALFTDYDNYRLQVLTPQSKWHVVEMEPKVKHPGGAVLMDGIIYVAEGSKSKEGKYHLLMYK